MKISAVVLTKNEEKNIVDCLDSLTFCDELIIIDDYSEDKTQEIVEAYQKSHQNVSFFKRKLNDNFSDQRQFGIEKAKNDWILFIDADERVTKELADEINSCLFEQHDGFLIPRTDFMWGKALGHGETGNIKLLRLFNKNKGQLKGKVHEVWVTKDLAGVLKNPILHYPHPTIREFLDEINYYTDLRAAELFENKVKVNFLSVVFYPKLKFIKNYLWNLGILDGIPGLVHAILMSFHSFLVRSKLWMLWQKK